MFVLILMKPVNVAKAANIIVTVVSSLFLRSILCAYLVASKVVMTEGMEWVIEE